MTEHGVQLVEFGDDLLQAFIGKAKLFGQCFDFGFCRRQELMQRRVEQANDDRQAVHDTEKTQEVFLLHGLDLG